MRGQDEVSKMFFQVRIEIDKQYLQLFFQQFSRVDKVKTFQMCHADLGNKPFTNFDVVSLSEFKKKS